MKNELLVSMLLLTSNIALAQNTLSDDAACKYQLQGVEHAIEQKEKGRVANIKLDMTKAELDAIVKSKGACGAMVEVNKRTAP